MKKFINSTANIVDDSINGLIRANCLLGIHPKNGRVVLRNDLNILNQNSVVTLVSGGGSGHEPFAAGKFNCFPRLEHGNSKCSLSFNQDMLAKMH